jgi:hypothetical protein
VILRTEICEKKKKRNTYFVLLPMTNPEPINGGDKFLFNTENSQRVGAQLLFTLPI